MSYFPALMATVILLIAILNGALAVPATPQFPDILIYDGKEYPVERDLMEAYFDKHPELNPKREDMGRQCSALWRGYRSTYEISDDRLFLKDIFTNVCERPVVSELIKVVPGGGRLALDWVTGLVVARYGDNPGDAYSLEFLDSWEKYSIFQFSGGKLDEVRHFDNKGYLAFRKRQFEAFKKTKDYEAQLKEGLADGSTQAAVDHALEFWFLGRTKKFLVK